MTTSDRVADFLLRHLKKLSALVVVIVLALAAGIPALRFSADNASFFGRDNRETRDLEELSNLYTGSSGFLIMVKPPEGEMFQVQTLEALKQMTADVWQAPFALRVDSPANFNHSRTEGDDILVEPLLDEYAEVTPEVAARFREVVSGSAELRNRLVAEDLKAYGISLNTVLSDDFEARRDELLTYLDQMKADWAERYPGYEIRMTGDVLGGLTLAEAARQDILTLVPIAFLLVISLLLYFLRVPLAVGGAAVVVLFGTLATFGFTGFLGIELTAGTAISPMAVMVLTAASCIHLILSWFRELDRSDRAAALHHAVSENLAPVLVTTVTTAIGFLGLNFAEAPPLQDMGNIVAFGLIIGMFANFTILPLALRASRARGGDRLPLREGMMRRLADLAIHHRRGWIFGFLALILVSVFGVTRIGYDDSLVRYFDDRFEFRQDSDAIQQHLTGLDNLQFSFTAPEGASVFDPDFLRDIDRFTTWIETQDNVVGVTSLTQIIKRLNMSMNDDDPAFETIGDSREANAQLMMFYELSLPVGLDLNSSIDVDRQSTRVVVLMRAEHSDEVRQLGEAAEAWMAANTPATQAHAAGISFAFSTVSERNNSQMLAGLLLVLVLVSLIMMATLRNIRMGLISLAPNLLPAIIAFGLWGITFRDVNLGSTVVTTMTFGIVVDDTVHFLMHYLDGRKKGRSTVDALHETFRVVGSAVIVTSICLAIGFMTMATSGFAINQHLGALTAIVIGFALLADLLFLPALLLSFDRTRT
ncbi:efflux RND transporter permease subunit [Oceanicola sp. S124]|uniref:efflux RND transporter permease subunit n=1 Tax=Oceanicola sp. S124 TaxID=1042378 RepID=UPI0002557955|nr:MMPL family transporter [Oceanicola sp. S124]